MGGLQNPYRAILISFAGFSFLILFIVLFLYCIFCWFNCSSRSPRNKAIDTDTETTQMTQVMDPDANVQDYMKALRGVDADGGR